jgi:hypothetical protein
VNRHARAAALRARARELRELADDIEGEHGGWSSLADVKRLRAAVLELRALILGWPR